MPKTFSIFQENDLKSRPRVPIGNHDLYQGFWGHLRTTFTPRSCSRSACCGRNMLPNHLANTLVKDKKRAFIPYGFHIGCYMVKEIVQAKQEGLSQLEYRFPTSRFRKHDPRGLVLQHASQVSSC
jgi:hypothetical protein